MEVDDGAEEASLDRGGAGAAGGAFVLPQSLLFSSRFEPVRFEDCEDGAGEVYPILGMILDRLHAIERKQIGLGSSVACGPRSGSFAQERRTPKGTANGQKAHQG